MGEQRHQEEERFQGQPSDATTRRASPDNRVDRALADMYAQLGPRIFWVIGCGSAGLGLFTAATTALMAGRYFGLTFGQTLSTAVIFSIADVLLMMVGVAASATQIRTMALWEGDSRNEANAPRVWISLVTHTKVTRRCALAIVAATPFEALYMIKRFDMPAWGWVPLTLGAVIALAGAMTLIMFVADLVNRPIREDVAAYLPPDFTPPPARINLKVKAVAPLPVVTLFAALFVGAFANLSATGLVRFTLVLATALVTVAAATLLFLAINRSLLRPIDDLIAATRRVQTGDYITPVPVVSTDELGILAYHFNQMVAGLQERERIRDAFATHVGLSVVKHVLKKDDLEAEEVDVSMLVTDIWGFTNYTERTKDDSKVFAMLNDKFDRIVPIIEDHGGRVDKFIGDGLLAVFGAPDRQTDHANRAFAAALEIDRAVNSTEGLRIGIGLNSGTVIAGSVGAHNRHEFGIIGGAVNAAARVESATRTTGDTILLTEHTRELLRETQFQFIARPDVQLKGKAGKVTLYAPILPGSAAISDDSSVEGDRPPG